MDKYTKHMYTTCPAGSTPHPHGSADLRLARELAEHVNPRPARVGRRRSPGPGCEPAAPVQPGTCGWGATAEPSERSPVTVCQPAGTARGRNSRRVVHFPGGPAACLRPIRPAAARPAAPGAPAPGTSGHGRPRDTCPLPRASRQADLPPPPTGGRAPELKEKRKIIAELTLLLKDPRLLRQAVRQELETIRERYGDERRTRIVSDEAEVFAEEDLIVDEETIVVLTEDGYIKRLKPELIRPSRRGGRGVQGMETKEEDAAATLLSTTTHSRVFFPSSTGRVFAIKAWEIPEGTRGSKGKLLRGLLPLAEDERVATMLESRDEERAKKFLVLVSERGVAKKTKLEEFANIRRSGIRALGLKEDDELGFAHFSSGKDDIMIATSQGKVLRMRERDLRPLSRAAAGVAGIRLKGDDRVIGMGVVPHGRDALTFTVSELGFAKKTPVKDYRVQKRGGVGIKTVRISPSSGKLARFAVLGSEEREVIFLTEKGQIIRIPIASIPTLSRTARGARVMKLTPGDKITGVTFL